MSFKITWFKASELEVISFPAKGNLPVFSSPKKPQNKIAITRPYAGITFKLSFCLSTNKIRIGKNTLKKTLKTLCYTTQK